MCLYLVLVVFVAAVVVVVDYLIAGRITNLWPAANLECLKSYERYVYHNSFLEGHCYASWFAHTSLTSLLMHCSAGGPKLPDPTMIGQASKLLVPCMTTTMLRWCPMVPNLEHLLMVAEDVCALSEPLASELWKWFVRVERGSIQCWGRPWFDIMSCQNHVPHQLILWGNTTVASTKSYEHAETSLKSLCSWWNILVIQYTETDCFTQACVSSHSELVPRGEFQQLLSFACSQGWTFAAYFP